MDQNGKKLKTVILIGLIFLMSCSFGRKKPCSEGGQAARPLGSTFKGIKRCYQTEDKDGKLVNDGKYYEWNNNDKLSLEGFYDLGKKTGRWVEYDENGKIISEEFYKNGAPIPAPPNERK